MSERQRVVDNLNAGLHTLLDRHSDAMLLGEDVADPYGGAFRVTRGLSERFPGRVRNTPISEGEIIGLATGLAFAGRPVVAEIMFSDFVTLGFDMLTNLAAKLPTMYGERRPIRMIVRTATGGGRGYGATHSQSLQKHFLGVPGLSILEMTPFHQASGLFDAMLHTGGPCLLFEDKILYTRRMSVDGRFGRLFRVSEAGPAPSIARLAMDGVPEPDYVLLCAGGMVERAADAAAALFFEHELCGEILVPAMLHPLDVATVTALARRAGRVFVLDEGQEGGTWAADVAYELTRTLWGTLRGPVEAICSPSAVIPSALHLERGALLQSDRIVAAVAAAMAGATAVR
jgi:pyruvate/2-oxoglutarate/acetoin dehydrogenase E1 component